MRPDPFNAIRNLRLVYGSETAEPPENDTAALATGLAKDIRPVPAILGVQSATMDSDGEKPVDVRSLLNNPLALGAVIGILLVALGWGLFQASRRIDPMPRGDG